MLQLCKVTASLFLGTARAACDDELLSREGVTFCINVTRQQPFPGLPRVRGIRVPVFDDPAEDLYRYFEPCGAAIEAALRGGGKCLVYCKNGRSRSAAICTAYLMRHRQLPLKDAFEDLLLHLRDGSTQQRKILLDLLNGQELAMSSSISALLGNPSNTNYLGSMGFQSSPIWQAVKTARPVAEPNAGFWSQLQRYEEDLQKLSQPGPLSKGLKTSNV